MLQLKKIIIFLISNISIEDLFNFHKNYLNFLTLGKKNNSDFSQVKKNFKFHFIDLIKEHVK